MGGALQTEHYYHHSKSDSDINYYKGEPQCHDLHLIQLLRIIFSNELAKSAFINFIRHEENSLSENYFKNANFAIIGSDEKKVSEVLSQHSDDNNNENINEIIYESLHPFFELMDAGTKTINIRI